MSTQELQEKLIVKIKNTKENYILEQVSRLLEFEENSGHVYNLNAEQQQLIDCSLKEIESGEYFKDEEVQKETDELHYSRITGQVVRERFDPIAIGPYSLSRYSGALQDNVGN